MRVIGLVISLERNKERHANAKRLASSLCIPTEIIKAVDGVELSRADRDHYSIKPLLSPKYPFRLSDAEIGCVLSHRKSWHYLLEGPYDAALILEDDVELLTSFSTAYEFAKEHIRATGYIQFQLRQPKGARELVSRGEHRLSVPIPPMLRTQCQLVSRSAAKRLLDASVKFDRPIDSVIQLHWITGVTPLALYPSGVAEVSAKLGGSTITKKSGILQRIHHEVARPIYRTRLAVAARKANQYVT